VSAVLGVEFWNGYENLRAALLAVKATVGDRAPTLVDFLPVSEPFQSFTRANERWQSCVLSVLFILFSLANWAFRSPAVWQYSVIALLPAAIIAVNLGGAFLALRLHSQISDSIDTLAHVEARNTALIGPSGGQSSKNSIPLHDFSRIGASRRGSASPGLEVAALDHIDLDQTATKGVQQNETEARKASLTTGEVRFLAKTEGGTTAEQAKKVLNLKKAMRDLITVSLTITVVATAFFVDAILVAVWSGNESIYRGRWGVSVLFPLSHIS
jgi:hypothetical protein